KGEPEDVNAFGRFPWKAGQFLDRPEATPPADAPDVLNDDERPRR
ncbi:hypothetical protein SAMN05192555_11189, partial [Franzmannia pantelleriensis]